MLKGLVLGNRGNRAALVMALLLGLLVATLTAVYLKQAGGNEGSATTGAAVPVVVAAQDIAAGTRIGAEMVTVKPVPEDVLLANAFRNTGDVVGNVARVAIVSGEQIVSSRLMGTGEAGQLLEANGLADVVPVEKAAAECAADRCGQRAVSVAVAPVSASGGMVRSGDHVDVVLAFGDGSAVTVLQDVEVLAIDQNLAQVARVSTSDGTGEERAVVSSGEQNAEATTVTLAVWPEEAQKLAAGEEFTKGSQLVLPTSMRDSLGLPADAQPQCTGSVRLVLRHAGQQGPVGGLEPRGTCASIFAYIWR